ncbi:MAG: stage V sporulation protein AA [Blautia sp.]|nr:stage V sporulation protein AA [Blautia sp.]
MKEKHEIVYVKADRNSVCYEPQVKISDVMSVECKDPAICAGIKNKTLYSFAKKENGKKKRIEVFSILNVIDLILREFPNVEVVSYGEQDFVVEYVPSVVAPKWREVCKVILLCIIIFLGSAFTVMAFNNDVSVGEVFDRFYGQFMGTEKPAVTEIEIFYCIGLAVGILVFFNHIGKKKITPDPTPIQVEMRKYEQDVDTTFIENAGRKGHEHDVG